MAKSMKESSAAAAEKMKEVGSKMANKFKSFFDWYVLIISYLNLYFIRLDIQNMVKSSFNTLIVL